MDLRLSADRTRYTVHPPAVPDPAPAELYDRFAAVRDEVLCAMETSTAGPLSPSVRNCFQRFVFLFFQKFVLPFSYARGFFQFHLLWHLSHVVNRRKCTQFGHLEFNNCLSFNFKSSFCSLSWIRDCFVSLSVVCFFITEGLLLIKHLYL